MLLKGWIWVMQLPGFDAGVSDYDRDAHSALLVLQERFN